MTAIAPGFLNTDMNGQPHGFDLDPAYQEKYLLFFPKMIYEYEADVKHPLTFVHPDGRQFRPDNHFFTDMGSVPRVLQILVPKDRFLLGFILHDSCYRFKGLWVSGNNGKSFLFTELLRAEADELLRLMAIYDPCPGNWLTSSAVWAGVRIGGWYGWGRGDERKPKLKGKIDNTKPPVSFA
jgi:hypothetical protein